MHGNGHLMVVVIGVCLVDSRATTNKDTGKPISTLLYSTLLHSTQIIPLYIRFVYPFEWLTTSVASPLPSERHSGQQVEQHSQYALL